MPVLPTFEPGGRPGEAAQSLVEGVNAGESWMSQAQNRQIQQQQAQDLHAEFLAKLPAIQAKSTADTVTAASSIALATRMQGLRAQAAIAAPTANNEFLDAMQLADPQYQFSELGRLQAKYAWMKNLPEYQPFLDAVDKSRGDAFHLVTANNLADATLERTQALVSGRQDIAETVAGSRQAVAETQAGARETAAEIAGKSRVDAATIRATAPKNYELETTMKLMQDAIDDGDAEGAAVYAARVAKLNHVHVTEDEIVAGAKPANTTVTPKARPKSSAPPAPVTFRVPNVNASGGAPAPKLYIAPQNPDEAPQLAPSVKTPEDVLHAYQQMVDDGVITSESAREALTKLGFRRK